MTHFVHLSGRTDTRRASLACCVCGSFAGRWLQHWNQDTGFGLCARCRDWLLTKNPYTPELMADLYGLPGRNYEGRTHRLFDRVFVVVAEFPEAEEERANAFMTKYQGASVLEVVDGRVILAWSADSGVVAPALEGAAS